MAQPTPNVLAIYPGFNDSSFWNYRRTCEMVGAKYTAPPLGLITVAAMLPDDWPVRLVDLNVEELGDADLDWADLVMTGGMLPQQRNTLPLVKMCEERGIPTVVGGPDVTTSPHLYEMASFRVLGEAEDVIDDFIAAYRRGDRTGTFEAPKFKADVTQTPIPRFDLLKFDNYIEIGLQFSRGCPFTCEFCDIIEIYGRRPRAKTTDQMLAEFQALYDLGYRGHVDLVDDNLIGNKKAVKGFLPHFIDWQKKHKYPFELSTEASLNLSEDEALLGMLRDAGFFAIFVGIESPDEDVLKAARKKQNTRKDIAESIKKIYGAGIFTVGGFIVGFDNESDRVADQISALIEEAAIPVAMVGLLFALPTTQLTRRLEAEGRLHDGHDVDYGFDDQCTTGLNFDTLRQRADVLTDFRMVVERVYAPEAYFGRIRRLADHLDMSGPNGALFNGMLGEDLKQMTRLLWTMAVKRRDWRGYFWKTLLACLIRRPRSIKPVLKNLALYAHLGPFSQFVITEIDRQIAELRQTDEAPQSVAAE